MSSYQGHLYHVLDSGPWASADDLAECISHELTKWQAKQRDPDARRRQYANYRVGLIQQAAQVLLSPSSRADYDEASPGFEAPLLIPASSARAPRRTLSRIVEVGCPSQALFEPELNGDKSPRLWSGETYLQHLSGWGTHNYSPWQDAPSEWASEVTDAQHTTFYFTDARIVHIAPTYVQPKFTATGYSGSVAGTAIDLAASAHHRAKAQRAVLGKALAGQVPWEYVFAIGVAPGREYNIEGGALVFSVSSGESEYEVGCVLEGAPLDWLRAQAEWCVRVAMRHRMNLFPDVLPNERIALLRTQEYLDPHIEEGALVYGLPLSLDASDALA